MRKFFLLLLIISYFMLPAQEAFTLDEAIAYGIENHNDVKDKYMDIADAESNIKEYLATGLPTLNGTVDYSNYIKLPTSIIPRGSFFAGDPDIGIEPNPPQDLEVQFGTKNNLTAGLRADALLFDGSFFVGLKASRLYKDLTQKQVQVAKDEIAVNISKAYLAVLVAEEQQKTIDKNISTLERTLFETEETYKSGFAEKLDVDRLSLSLANLTVEKERMQNLVALSENMLKFQMGYPMQDSITLSDELAAHLVDLNESGNFFINDFDFNTRSEYQVLKSTEALRVLNVKQIQMRYLPTLRAFGSYNQSLQTNKLTDGKWFPSALVGLTLDIPIFDGRDKSSKIQRAKIALDKHQLIIDNFERATTLEIDNAKLAFENAMETADNTKANLELAENIFNTIQIKFKEGVGSSVELSQAERELYTAQNNHTNALYDVIIAKVDLDKAYGTILKSE